MKARHYIPGGFFMLLTMILLFGARVPVSFAETADPAVSDAGRDPYFSNVTAEADLTGVVGFRLSLADVNGDDYPDIFAHIPLDHGAGDVLNKQFLYLNVPGDTPGSRKFVDFTDDSNIRANRQGTEDGRHSDSAIFADVDNDGDLDIFTLVYLHSNYTLNEGTNDLLLNDGQGHFTLAPNSPFHNEPIYNTAGAVFADYNNDGNVDLFIGNWYMNNVLSEDQLYMGHGDGSFTNVTAQAGIDAAVTSIYGLAACDWNNDGFTDLFAPSYSHTRPAARSIHWQNNRDGTFTQVQDTTHYTEYTGYESGMASFGSMPRDYDNDGDIDFFEILVHGYGDGAGSVHSTVLTNTNNVFSWDFDRVDGRAAEDPRINHHGDHYSTWFDIENDGLSDFALTESGYDNNRIYVFQQSPAHTFAPVTGASGLDPINTANLPPHNALALDYDLDGDEDLLVGFAGTEGIQLWRNDVGTQNNWLTLTLEGAGMPGYSNRSAIGARVEVSSGGNTYTREVYAGNGHHGPQVPLSLTFGLGAATAVDEIEVRWPNEDQSRTLLKNIAVNQFLTIVERLEPAIITGPGPGKSNPPEVRGFNIGHSDSPVYAFSAYGVNQYGVNVSAGDLDGTGHPEIVTGPGPGAVFGPHVRGWTISGIPIPAVSFLAYGTRKFGALVALGDLDNDGYDEIITGAGPGAVFGPHVRAFNYDSAPPVTPMNGVSFFAYGTRKWGVNVTSGDIDGDDFHEIITGAGPGAIFGPHVRGWNVDGGTAVAIPAVSFLAYGTKKYGVNVGSGNVDGDAFDEIITAPGPSGLFGSHIRGWNYDNSSITSLPGCSFFAWPSSEARYGARVFAGAELNEDDRDELVVGCGPDPLLASGVKVFLYNGTQVTEWFSLQAYPSGWVYGANVAAAGF